MFKLDDSFLDGMGLDDMPEDEKNAFLGHLQEELEVEVGEQISEGLPEAVIEQFEKIIEGDSDVISKMLEEAGDYKQDDMYKKILENTGYADGSPEALGEYASMLWLHQNRPDYQEIIEDAIANIKSVIMESKEALLNKSE